MQDTVSLTKSKKEWHTPRMVEVFYPSKIGSTQDRHNWIKAMMLDARLSNRDKTVLTRLALHLNLETGRCDPTIDLLALETSIPGSEESARRIVRRSLARADKLGWIERTGRHAGSRWNRSNSYRLRIPKDIHPDKFDWSSGQIEVVDRTPESGRIGKENREGYIKRGEFEKGGSGRPLGPREATVFVAAALQKNLNTPGSILEYAQKLGYSLPDNQLAAAMAACATPADVGARTEGVEP